MIGRPDSALVLGAKRSALEHGLRHEELSATELKTRFPMLNPEPDMIAIWEPRAGILFPEPAIQAHLDLALKQDARLRFDEPVLEWKPIAGGVAVETKNGRYTAKQLLLTAGAWLSGLVPELALPLTIERQVLFWFEPRSDRKEFSPEKCPIHLWQFGPHHFFYGFPDLGDGVKAAVHHQGEIVQADTVRREVDDNEKTEMTSLLRRFLPTAAGKLKSSEVCLYTNTPDEHFILDYHPAHRDVVIASPCSGHGFKFSSVIGEIAADMLDDIGPKFDLSLFKINRFPSRL